MFHTPAHKAVAAPAAQFSISEEPPSHFVFSNHGSVCLLVPVGPCAVTWIECNVSTDQLVWFGKGIAVDPRYADDLLNAIHNDGFEVRS